MGGDDDKNDLFGDSSSDADTDDLIAAAKSQPIARRKGGGSVPAISPKEKTTKDADDDDDDDDDDGGGNDEDDEDHDDDAAGLFDSSSDDDDGEGGGSGSRKKLGKKRKAGAAKKARAGRSKADSSTANSKSATKDTRSMKERMEALARKRAERGEAAASSSGGKDGREPRKKRSKSDGKRKSGGGGGGEGDGGEKEDGGYKSGDSYDSENSATYVRTKEDDDFIDDDEDDEDAKKELYAEQHFDDERPDGYDSDEKEDRKKKGRKSSKSGGKGGLDKISLSDDEEGGGGIVNATNALKAAVRGMQKSKKKAPGLAQLEEEGNNFLRRMTEAADADDKSISAKRPALRKLAMMQEVTDMLVRTSPEGKDGPSMVRVLLDNDLLTVCKRWIQPLPDGALGNVTLRRRLVEVISAMTGDSGISSSDLKRSGFGKTVAALYMHKSETPEMKKMLKGMIEQWSRLIYQKSGNLHDLEGAQAARGYSDPGSLVGMAHARHLEAKREENERHSRVASGSGNRSHPAAAAASSSSTSSAGRGRTEDDLERIITSGGDAAARDLGNNRVRIPFSKGFQYSVRPESRKGNVTDSRNLISGKKAAGGGTIVDERRGALSKRMEAKSKKSNKATQRSANISIEGRVVK